MNEKCTNYVCEKRYDCKYSITHYDAMKVSSVFVNNEHTCEKYEVIKNDK
jgi:hypothetical protein